MEVKEFQKRIVKFVQSWDKKRSFTANEQSAFTHLVEEVGELARQYVNKEQRKDQYSQEEVDDAIGDILMQIVRLGDLRGLDIEEVVKKIIKEEQP